MEHGHTDDFTIEPYRPAYREQILEIFYATGLLGKSLEPAFSSPRFLELLFLRYYTQYEPQSLWVAVSEGSTVVGYLLGCQNTKRQRRVFLTHILPRLLPGFFIHNVPWRKRNWAFIGRWLWGMLRGEFRTAYADELYQKYPAHLHVSVRRPWRRAGVGQAMLQHFFDQLTDARITGVHLQAYGPPQPDSTGALRFFASMGFREWARRPVQLFHAFRAGPLHRVTMVRHLELFKG